MILLTFLVKWQLSQASASIMTLWRRSKTEPTPMPAVAEARKSEKEPLALGGKGRVNRAAKIGSNLPPELRGAQSRVEGQTSIAIVRPEKSLKSKLTGLNPGLIFDARVPHSLIAFPGDEEPVVALARLLGLESEIKLLGHSRFEPNSHRIFIDFTKLIQGGKSFDVRAVAQAEDGTQGIEGEYHTNSGLYFAAEFISNMVAAYFESRVPRTVNVYGTLDSQSDLTSALNKGLQGGALSSADRMRERLRKSPEFTEAKGPLNIRVLILD